MISRQEVQKLAALARIKLTPEEEDVLAKDMESILGYVKQIQEVPVPKEMFRSEKVKNVLRNDGEPHEPGAYTKEIIGEAPRHEGDCIKVKKILS